MNKTLSKSVIIMFLYDALIFGLSSYFWYAKFNLTSKMLIPAVLLIVATGLFTLFLKANYKIREFNNTLKNCYLLFEGVIFSQIPVAILLAFFNLNYSLAKFLILNTITIFVLLKVYRIVFHYYLFNFKRVKNILIIGTNKNAKLMADEILAKKALRMNVVGFVKDTNDDEICVSDSTQIYSMQDGLDKIIAEKSVDIVIVAIHRRMEEAFLTEMVNSIPSRVKLYTMPEFYEMVTGKYFIDRMSINGLFFNFMKNRSLAYDICKRIYDIIAATIILTVTLPILLYIAIRVKLTDGGDPMFTQTRVGKGGKTFKIYKLRTMYVNDYTPKNTEDVKYADSVKGDDRIIPFCRFVRKARFDEIPQMINIIKGEMSIVGPRAEWLDEVEIFCKKISYYPCRMWVKTGWTGWSHINMEPVFNVDEEKERLAYDLYYLKHRNVLWEIGILVKAVFLALGGRHK